MKLYQKLASLVVARRNCIKSGNSEWEGRHEDEILSLVKDKMPSGSGIDTGTKIDLDASTGEKLVFNCSYHHMNEHGYYDGWTEHKVTVRPCFSGIDITISGRNRNEIKDYLADCYYLSLTEEA